MGRSRRGGGGRSGGGLFGSRKAAPQRSLAPATRPAAPPALPQKKSGGMLSGIGSTIAQVRFYFGVR